MVALSCPPGDPVVGAAAPETLVVGTQRSVFPRDASWQVSVQPPGALPTALNRHPVCAQRTRPVPGPHGHAQSLSEARATGCTDVVPGPWASG